MTKRATTSRKRRTNSKSGNSGRSTTKATSTSNASTSATAPASFEAVFGPNPKTDAQRLRYARLLEASQTRLLHLTSLPEPKLALQRRETLERMRRERRRSKELQEALDQWED